jgi:hypothetical protein
MRELRKASNERRNSLKDPTMGFSQHFSGGVNYLWITSFRCRVVKGQTILNHIDCSRFLSMLQTCNAPDKRSVSLLFEWVRLGLLSIRLETDMRSNMVRLLQQNDGSFRCLRFY